MKGINLSFIVWMEHEVWSYHFILLDQPINNTAKKVVFARSENKL